MNAEDVTVAWKLMVGIYAAGFVFSRLAVLLMAPLNLVATLFLILLVIGNVAVNIFFWYSSTRRRRPTICCRDEWAWKMR